MHSGVTEVSRRDKIVGGLNLVLGKLTRDPVRVFEGQVRAQGAIVALRGEERVELIDDTQTEGFLEYGWMHVVTLFAE